MILGKEHILEAIESGDIIADGVNHNNVGTNSIDVTLGDELFEVVGNVNSFNFLDENLRINDLIDLNKPSKIRRVDYDSSAGWIIRPGRLYLGTTAETVGSKKYVPIMHGRSTPARSGFSPIVSAGYGDVGFIGKWTLEITTQAHPMIIKAGMRIAQIEFQEVSSTKYQYTDRGNYVGQDSVRAGKEGNV
jgi:dCTP deaminase